MSAMPLSALVKTHELCGKCGVMVPTRFLSCPACLGFEKRHEQWSQPAKRKVKRQPIHKPSFFDEVQEHPR
jgi:hypothetical protein